MQPDQTDPSWGQVWHLPLLQLAHILNKFIMSNWQLPVVNSQDNCKNKHC